MATTIVFETHARSEDNERGIASGWAHRLDDLALRSRGARVLVIGHVATRWALDHHLDGVALETLVADDFSWQDGWEYEITA
jgi:hypothetical protein